MKYSLTLQEKPTEHYQLNEFLEFGDINGEFGLMLSTIDEQEQKTLDFLNELENIKDVKVFLRVKSEDSVIIYSKKLLVEIAEDYEVVTDENDVVDFQPLNKFSYSLYFS